MNVYLFHDLCTWCCRIISPENLLFSHSEFRRTKVLDISTCQRTLLCWEVSGAALIRVNRNYRKWCDVDLSNWKLTTWRSRAYYLVAIAWVTVLVPSRLRQMTATHLMIELLAGVRSSNELERFNSKIGHQHITVKPVYNDHLIYFSAFWSSSRWPRAT